MRGIGARSLGYCAGLLTLVAVGWILTGRAASPRQQGLPTDWSHRHVIFSQPSTDAQAAAVMHDPRYWQQWNRTHFVKALSLGDVGFTNSSLFASAGTSHADWSQNLGSGANAGPGVFPAKYSFQATSATCAGGVGVKPDYVVFSTGLGSGASIVAFENGVSRSGADTHNVGQLGSTHRRNCMSSSQRQYSDRKYGGNFCAA